MGSPAAVMGDKVTGQCPVHLIPGPVGNPQPGPPLPFSAPLLQGTVSTVLICGKPAAVQGASGFCTPPHVGLHPADPCLVPTMQKGTVVMASLTVLIGGQGAATASSTCTICNGVPGTLVASAATVMIGQ